MKKRKKASGRLLSPVLHGYISAFHERLPTPLHSKGNRKEINNHASLPVRLGTPNHYTAMYLHSAPFEGSRCWYNTAWGSSTPAKLFACLLSPLQSNCTSCKSLISFLLYRPHTQKCLEKAHWPAGSAQIFQFLATCPPSQTPEARRNFAYFCCMTEIVHCMVEPTERMKTFNISTSKA